MEWNYTSGTIWHSIEKNIRQFLSLNQIRRGIYSGNSALSAIMNKVFYIVLFIFILLIFSVSAYYLINRQAPLPPFSNQPGFTQIYTPKPGGRVFTAMDTSGENCAADGIRFNIANEHTLVDRESTWIFTLNNDPKPCTDKPWCRQNILSQFR